jgi:hypothetical protein
MRRSIKEVVYLSDNQAVEVPKGSSYLPGLGYWHMVPAVRTRQPNAPYVAGSFTIQAAGEILMRGVSREAIKQMIDRIADDLNDLEYEALAAAKCWCNTDDISLYILKEFKCYEDPTLLKSQKVGVFGWQEIAVVNKSKWVKNKGELYDKKT